MEQGQAMALALLQSVLMVEQAVIKLALSVLAAALVTGLSAVLIASRIERIHSALVRYAERLTWMKK